MSPNSEFSNNSNSSIFDGLVKYLEEDSKLHQAVFILDDSLNSTDIIMNSLIKTVNSHFPSYRVNYEELEFSNAKESFFKLLKTVKRTTLIVLQILTDSAFESIFKKISYIFRETLKPKCLVVISFPVSEDDIENVLNSFHKIEFLDISVVSYSQHVKGKIEQTSPVLIVSEMNPFFNISSSNPLSFKSQWFPNKLFNLNGKKLDFSCQPVNDSSEYEYKRGIKFLDILQQEMNFQPKIRHRISKGGKVVLTANEEDSFSLWDELLDQSYDTDTEIKLNIITTYRKNIAALANAQIFRITNLRAVIPNDVKVSKDIEVSSEFWYMTSATIGTIAIIRLLAFLLKFRRSTWQTLNISQIVIGMSNPEKPDTLAARIIYGTLLISCIVYSGYIYSVILDISIRSSPEISNFTELVKSHITPRIGYDLPYYRRQETEKSSIQQWLDKSTRFANGDEEECLKFLAKYRNISCVLDDAAYHVNAYQVKHGFINVRILRKTISNGIRAFIMKSDSLYTERINEIILKASGFGLLKEFYDDIPNLRSSITEPELITKEKLLPVLLCVLVVGYSLSIIAFLFEVITAKLRSFFYKPKFRFVN